MVHKAWHNIEEVPYYFSRSSIKFQGHKGWKIDYLNPIWLRLLGRSQLSNHSDLTCLNSLNNISQVQMTLNHSLPTWTDFSKHPSIVQPDNVSSCATGCNFVPLHILVSAMVSSENPSRNIHYALKGSISIPELLFVWQQEIPFWRYKALTTILSPLWAFL